MGYFIFIFYLFLNINLLISNSESRPIPNDQDQSNMENDWTFGITDISTSAMGWIYDQMYSTSPKLELNLKNNSSLEGSEHPTNKQILDEDETPKLVTSDSEISSLNESKSAEKVDDILEIVNNSNDEEKKQYLPFLEDLHHTINNNPTRYVKIFLKNVWHLVDLGVFKSGERRRCSDYVEGTIRIIKELLYEIFTTILNFATGNFEGGKKEIQKIWARYERTKEQDHREWTEKDALEELEDLENNYQKNMNKDYLFKELTTLCMQPLFKVSTYEKIIAFIRKLQEAGYDKTKLQTAFNYVEYKLQFSKNHNIR